jgi:hypothetical protein
MKVKTILGKVYQSQRLLINEIINDKTMQSDKCIKCMLFKFQILLDYIEKLATFGSDNSTKSNLNIV